MTDQSGTGKVYSSRGKVTAAEIITGMKLEGAVDEAVFRAALETMKHLQTGSVSGATGVEATGDIVTGFRYLNPKAPDRRQFLAELQALRADLAAAAAAPEAPAEAADAVESLDEALAEAQQETPRARRIANRLKETLEFISDAGKALDAASKAGGLILKAIPVATGLYQLAQLVF